MKTTIRILAPDAAASNAAVVAEDQHKQEVLAVQQDVDNMDQMPFVDNDQDIFETDNFHDCRTWSEDKHCNVIQSGVL